MISGFRYLVTIVYHHSKQNFIFLYAVINLNIFLNFQLTDRNNIYIILLTLIFRFDQ